MFNVWHVANGQGSCVLTYDMYVWQLACCVWRLAYSAWLVACGDGSHVLMYVLHGMAISVLYMAYGAKRMACGI